MNVDRLGMICAGVLAFGCLILGFLAMMIDRTPAGVQAAGVFIVIVSNVVTGTFSYMRGHAAGQTNAPNTKPTSPTIIGT